MADLLKVGSVYVQFAYESDPVEKVGSVYTQIAYDETPGIMVSQSSMVYLYDEPPSIRVSQLTMQFAYGGVIPHEDGTSSGGFVFGGTVVEIGETDFTEAIASGGFVFGGTGEAYEPPENHQVEGAMYGGIVFGGTVGEQWQSEQNNLVAVKGGVYRINGVLYTLTNDMTLSGLGDIAEIVDCGPPPTTNGYYRYDLLSIGTTGTITLTAGTEATTPVMPTTPTGEVKLDHVLRYYGQTSIVQADVGKLYQAPSLASLTATITDDDLAWGENSTTITIRTYDQYGALYSGASVINAIMSSGTGSVNPPSRSGSTSSFSFTYSRDLSGTEESPIITFTSSTGISIVASILLRDSGGTIL